MQASKQKLWQALSGLCCSHPWHGVSLGSQVPDCVQCYIELVSGDTVKYELDKQTGLLRLDRPQSYSNICPSMYGLLPQTLCSSRVADRCAQRTGLSSVVGDEDPLDICVLSEREVSHGNLLVSAIPIGGLRMIDAGEADDKIIAVLQGDAVYGACRDLSDLGDAVLNRLKHYFLTYKQDPASTEGHCSIFESYGREEAHHIIHLAQQDYHDRYGCMQEILQKTIESTESL